MKNLLDEIFYIMGILTVILGFLDLLLDNSAGAIFVGIGIFIVVFRRRRIKKSQEKQIHEPLPLCPARKYSIPT